MKTNELFENDIQIIHKQNKEGINEIERMNERINEPKRIKTIRQQTIAFF